MVEQILYYLSHENERSEITENAYRLATQELTMANSLKAIVQAAENKMASKYGVFQGAGPASYSRRG